MHVLDFLAGLQNQRSDDIATFEYRLLCSGELYNGNVMTADWRKSDATRFLLRAPFKLFICSHPFNDYPQEIALTFKTSLITEQRGITSFISYFDLEIAQDLAALLSLFCRRLITVAAKVKEVHPQQYGSESESFLDWPIGFVNSLRVSNWERHPAVVAYGLGGIKGIIDYNPPPLGVASDHLQSLFTALPDLRQAESFVFSARLYALALEHISDDVDISYQLLISSIEAIANDVFKSFTPSESEMVGTKKSVAKLATEFGLPEDKARQLAIEACKGITWSRRKFTKFICDYTDDALWVENDLFRVPADFLPKKENFKSALAQIYGMRGKATHGGRAYPTIAKIGTDPMIPAEAMLDIGGMLDTDGSQSVFPPVAWFERVVNYSLRGFLHHSMKASAEEKGPHASQPSRSFPERLKKEDRLSDSTNQASQP
jgi:hypothetical protein